ncbi:MAG: glycoside hydrolase family 95 protein, partial [bacterium]
MTEPNGVTRREFMLQTAVLAGSMLVSRTPPVGAMTPPTAPEFADSTLTLWYKRPAAQWVEALPIGNGRLGAMVFGGIERERLQLNEGTLWSGGPKDWNNPKAPAVLAEVRRLISEEKFAEADVASRGMQGPFTQSYQPLGDLYLAFEHGDQARGGYRRQLDIASAVTEVSYRIGATSYKREIFASHPDQVIAIRLSADKPGVISFTASLDTQLRHRLSMDGDVLKLIGKAPSNVDPSGHDRDFPVQYDETGGMTFETHLSAVATGGKAWIEQGELHVQGADEVVLRLAAATSFNGFDKHPVREGKQPGAIASAQLRAAMGRSFAAMRDAHVADHRALFDRVSLEIEPTSPPTDIPTDERIASLGVKDPTLVKTFFQYGRYLLIACSRPGGQPATLQGL